MAIVHAVRSDAFAGVERSVVLSARSLARRGHSVTVVGGNPERMRTELANSTVAWLPAATTAEAARAIHRVGRVDIVHAHMTAAECAAIIAGGLRRVPIVATRHFARRRGESRIGRLAAPIVGRFVRTEIAVSRYVARHLERPACVVYHGIEGRDQVACEDGTVLVVQRLEPEKHTDVAIRAFQRSQLWQEGWALVVAGSGTEERRLRTLANELGVAASVRFLGRVTDVDELRRTSSFQLATVPIEGFGLAVLEAMACGLPVVAADAGAHSELLGRLGHYFSPGDADQAATSLRLLAGDRPLRKRLGVEVRSRQQVAFSLEAHGAALETVYHSALVAR